MVQQSAFRINTYTVAPTFFFLSLSLLILGTKLLHVVVDYDITVALTEALNYIS